MRVQPFLAASSFSLELYVCFYDCGDCAWQNQPGADNSNLFHIKSFLHDTFLQTCIPKMHAINETTLPSAILLGRASFYVDPRTMSFDTITFFRMEFS